MTFRHGRNRTDEPRETEPNTSVTDGCVDSERQPDSAITADQLREWRRWIVETFLHANYGVVPVDTLAAAVSEREPDDVEESVVRAGLTETVLPELDAAGVVDYEVARDVVINYGT